VILLDTDILVDVALDRQPFCVAAGEWPPLQDFEDALQVAAARACGASFIATRNVKDFRNSPITAKTRQELVAEFI
jgi:hypothetical protein